MKPSRLTDFDPWEWPEEAGTALLRYLGDRGAEAPERLAAAELAGEIVAGHEDLARTLVAVVAAEDEAPEIRRRAAISLGPALEDFEMSDNWEVPGLEELDSEDSISPELVDEIQRSFQRLYLDEHAPSEVRRAVLEAAVRSSAEWHSGAVRDAYAHSDHDWRVTAVFCMQFVGGFETEILEALASNDPDLEYEAVRAAGVREIPEAYEHVRALACGEDVDKALRLEAIEALATIRPHAARELLSELEDSDDEDIAEAAREAMSYADAVDPGTFDEEDPDAELDDLEDEEED